MVFVVCEIHGENNAFLIVINLESLGQNKHLTESLRVDLCAHNIRLINLVDRPLLAQIKSYLVSGKSPKMIFFKFTPERYSTLTNWG